MRAPPLRSLSLTCPTQIHTHVRPAAAPRDCALSASRALPTATHMHAPPLRPAGVLFGERNLKYGGRVHFEDPQNEVRQP